MSPSTSRGETLAKVAAAIVAVHLVLRLAGASVHTSVLVGMPQSEASYVLGPLHVVFALLAVVVAPILGAVAALELVLGRLSSARSEPSRRCPRRAHG